jgi:hypothetical protein
MHTLDNFISPVLDFDGDIPILAISVSALLAMNQQVTLLPEPVPVP